MSHERVWRSDATRGRPAARKRPASPGRRGAQERRTAAAVPRRRGAARTYANQTRSVRRRRMMTLGSASRRLHVGFAVVAVIVLVLGGRLVQLQGLDSKSRASASERMRLRTVAIDAERGKILDADGNVLAYSVDAKAITADPSQVSDPFRTAQRLAPVLGVSAGEMQKALARKVCPTKAAAHAECRFAYLARGIEPAIAARVSRLGLEGVYQQSEPQRLYPGRAVGSTVIGFTDRAGEGVAGIEKNYDGVLKGTPGTRTYEQGSGGEIIPSGVHRETDAKPGGSVQLTVSQDLQYFTQEALATAVAGAAARSGQVSVLDVRTGHVLAMASTGMYDSQDPGKSTTPGTNPNVSSIFEPGSVNKVVAFTAALDAGIITPTTPFTVPGEIPFADRVIHDDWVHSPVDWTATGIIAKSSNVGTLMIAKKVGPTAWLEYAKRYGEGERTGVELPGESRGVLPPRATWSGSTFGNLPIGQGVALTSLQMASIYQAVANNGVRIPPRIVGKVSDAAGNASIPAAAVPVRVMKPSTSKTLRAMLSMVTQEGGTGRKAAIDGYVVSGKTGTGQQVDASCRCYSDHVYWSTFAGMAPADNPRYVVSVMIDSPQRSYMGGDVAAPLFRQVMSYALAHGGVAPSGAKQPGLPFYPAGPN